MAQIESALRPDAAQRIQDLGHADLVVGIPCYNSEKTLAHVIQTVSEGLAFAEPHARSLIIVSDGGSTDDTREIALECPVRPWQEKLVTIYRGPDGKGSAVRLVLEAAETLRARACAVVDSDLRSITPAWIKQLLDPVMAETFDLVTPLYLRHRLDGTITNHVVYHMTRALYGKRIRQPIGGEFGISPKLVSHYNAQEVWESDVARFGVDIWMTTSAVTNGFRVCQTHLGTKVHQAKDPATSLGPMFRQVVGTLFALMERYEIAWKNVFGSEPVETLGSPDPTEPEPVTVDQAELVYRFRTGFQQFGPLWRHVLAFDDFVEIKRLVNVAPDDFQIDTDCWVRIVYQLAATYHRWPENRQKLIEFMTPLYYGAVASFVNSSRSLTTEEAEAVIENEALAFERRKPYLLELWNRAEISGGEEVLIPPVT